MKNKKEAIILTAALVLPGGLVVLGLWKAYEIYKKKPKKAETRLADPIPAEDQPTKAYVDQQTTK